MKPYDFITKLMREKEELSREDHAICRTLMLTMSREEVDELYNSEPLDFYLCRLIEELQQGKALGRNTGRVHYKSWQYYLNNLRDRTVGRVTDSREKLRAIFDSLEWKAQREILRFCLTDALKIDRIWGLKCMNNNWSIIADCKRAEREEWKERMVAAWEKYHEKEAALIMVRYLDLTVIEQQAPALISLLGYNHVAVRLGENPDFYIDRSRLTALEYLYIMVKGHRPVTSEEAEEVLAQTIQEVTGTKRTPIMHQNSSPSLMCDSKIGLVIWCMGELRLTDSIITFYERDCALQKELNRYRETMSEERMDNNDQAWNWLCDHAKEFFPSLNGNSIR